MGEEKLDRKLQMAVLIDADNISAGYAAAIFDELDQYGYATCRRIYGNWSQNNSWKRDILLEYSIMPVQQFDYTTGKNSTDMAMVIDAMDLLYKDAVDGFCLVTSDCDFTRLAMRLREERKYVLGMGESKAPKALTRSCNKFIHLDLIRDHEKEEEKEEDVGSVTDIKKIEDAILTMLGSSEKQRIGLAELGSRLGNKYPDFDVRNYGYTKLSVLLQKEIKTVRLYKDGSNHMVCFAEKEIPSQQMIEKEIFNILHRQKGELENSIIYREIKKKYPHFDYKDYGFSRFSKYLRSLKGIRISANNDKAEWKM